MMPQSLQIHHLPIKYMLNGAVKLLQPSCHAGKMPPESLQAPAHACQESISTVSWGSDA